VYSVRSAIEKKKATFFINIQHISRSDSNVRVNLLEHEADHSFYQMPRLRMHGAVKCHTGRPWPSYKVSTIQGPITENYEGCVVLIQCSHLISDKSQCEQI
jgi:hypothetical protein